MSMSSVIEAPSLTLSESAAKRIAFLVAQEEEPDTKLRITVSGGGCSGFRYDFSFDAAVNEDDRVFERDGAKVVIDEVSLDLLGGSVVDFVDDLMGAYFAIQNPNASSSCGCGTSFSI
ncbi:MAG TPA: iron-sulfur cluster insertion protein ErpA [Kiloniellales bacterium]|nr:iron-sulfur cluster insertion protein ErpA [Kiloniellales bacterium]